MFHRKLKHSGLALAIAAVGFAQSASAAGFIEDSKASLGLRNFYINQDNRNGSAAPGKQEEWGQGFLLNYASGFTEGTVGFGVDALGLLGTRLDSSRDKHYNPDSSGFGGVVFPTDSNGRAVSNFASLGLTAKAKVSETELRFGTLQPKLPVVTYNDGRLLPQTFTGGQVTSREFKDLTFVAGQLEHTKGRNSTNSDQGLSIAGANNAQTGKFGNKFYYGGGDYKINEDTTVQYYYGNLKNFYQQHFLGLQHNWALGEGVLKSDLRYFNSSSDGRNGKDLAYASSGYYGSGVTKGKVDNRAFSGQLTYTIQGHSFGAGHQKLTGKSDFPFINDGDGASTYLITDSQIGKFQHAGEQTWLVRYGYDFAALGVPGLNFQTAYLRGSNVKTGAGKQTEWERDISLGYVVQDGPLKNLGVAWKNASLRSGLPAAATPGSATQRDQDENRVIVSYTLPLM
jgi:hypothetical protein